MIGIVAARLKERYERPACVIALADGIGKGSGRSVPGLPLGPAVIAARQAGLLHQRRRPCDGGGLHGRRRKARRRCAPSSPSGWATGSTRERLVPELRRSTARCPPRRRNAELIDHLDALAPFGAANPEPRFAFPNVRVCACRAGRDWPSAMHLRRSGRDRRDGCGSDRLPRRRNAARPVPRRDPRPGDPRCRPSPARRLARRRRGPARRSTTPPAPTPPDPSIDCAADASAWRSGLRPRLIVKPQSGLSRGGNRAHIPSV